ncbi:MULTISPECIES: acyltransferase family protein [Acinetobacter]|uniref:acyltransferase family protein n=1 Tax=Acinetobacter TaxID=469 RepID=UPI0004D53B24|nr:MULTISPECIES: acyltransferase [unclassified Acinetobacter]KEC82806.1 acyltransferase [Acinetobacter sp. ETR1]WEE40338.1 acyltransferase [Acinetobacter sp. TAC-1]
MRNNKIDLLRGISILLVLLHHFNIPYKLHDTFLGIQIFGESLSTLIARNGNYGVTLFFVISGFLITQHTLQRSGTLAQIKLKDFYIRRIARIMPCLVLLVVLVTALGAMGLKPFINQAPNDIEVSYGLTVFSAFTFWMNILIIENGWVNYALGVLWSLSVEEVFYLVFPILCVVLGRGKGFIIFLLAIIVYAPYFRSLHFAEESGAYLYHYFSSFDGIAIGCLTALMTQRMSQKIQVSRIVVPIIVVLMVTVYLYAPIKEVSTWGISLFALLSAMLIFCFAQNPHTESRSILSKGIAWIGQRSYEMYLFHLIILGLFKVFYFPKETLASEKLMLLPIYFIAVFVLSWAIEKYYSTPMNAKIRNWLIKRH